MQLIDGKKISEEIKIEIAEEVKRWTANGGKVPHLAAIIVGNNAASETYVASKVKSCEQVGFKSTRINFPETISEKELITKIVEINNIEDIDGLIVQLPLPKHISENKIVETISYKKDVDGFHPENIGRLVIGLPCYLPATPFGIIELIKRYKIETSGKNCVVVGRSNIVGTPVSILMSRKSYPGNATVTLCHSKTENLENICKNADILIAAIGIPGFIKANMVKENAVVIDVGIHRIPSDKTKSGFKLTGDVQFEEVAPKCSFISPVPGGVGLMTTVSLLQNTLFSAKKKIYT